MKETYKKQYLLLRQIIGVVGIIFPIVLLAGCLISSFGAIPTSFSESYYTPMRDHFVGALFVIGFFLGAYKGYDKLDMVICITMGVSAVFAALIPTPEIPHFIFASITFLGMAYMSFFMFTKTDKYYILTKRKLKRNVVYKVCGVIILLCLIMIGLTKFIPDADKYKLVFWLEWLLLWAFSVPWVVKGEVLLKDKV